MDTKFFVSRRKARGLSQAVLCEGICTQSTLSKFENNTQVPSLPILRQLCERLDLSIDDLDEERRRSDWLRPQLDWTEEELMVENYQRAKQLLAAIPTAEITSTTAKMQYSYLQGLLATLVGAADTTALFSVTRILDELDEEHQTIFAQLAYLGEGILYARRRALDQAAFFMAKVKTYLEQLTEQNDPHGDNVNNARLLTMVYYLAEYHALIKEYDQSNKYLDQGLTRCAQEHVTYFLPRLKLLAAQNALETGASPAVVIDNLLDARAFARLNHNNTVLVQSMSLIKHYQDLLAGKPLDEGNAK